MTLVFMFPGQSSCYPSMLDKLATASPAARGVLAQASRVLGRDLSAHYRDDNPDVFAKNRDVQIGVFLANHLHLTALCEQGIDAAVSLGLSLGEWNHLVHIGAVAFEDALRAVDERGQAYDDGPRGCMAAIFPIDVAELSPLVERARAAGVVEIVNLNSPRQQVIAGETAAVSEAIRLIEDETYARAIIIDQQVPMHCSVFAPVAERFRRHLEGMRFAAPSRPYLSNRLGDFVDGPNAPTFVELLATHVYRPVLWQESIDHVMARHPNAVLVEVGPKRVLTGLLDKKWLRDVKKLHTDSDADWQAHLQGLVATLQATVH